MQTYKNTQIGYWIIFILGLAATPSFILIYYNNFNWIGVIVSFILVLCLGLISTLTVVVEYNFFKIELGPIKIIKKNLNLEDIKRYKIIDIPWYFRYFLGVRLISNGWWYNISGSKKAIQIEMRTGKKYQISIDEAEKLAEILDQSIRQE